MAYADLLINTCTIKRYTEGAIDSYGNPAQTWADHLTDQPCRWSTPKNTEIKVGAEVVIVEKQLFLNDIDVDEQDRVVLGSDTYEILAVVDRQDGTADHHKEAFLRRVQA